jgi:uncharacterized protein (DUF1778 family)
MSCRFSATKVVVIAETVCRELKHELMQFCRQIGDSSGQFMLLACVITYEERGVKLRMAKSKKNKNKPKLNLTVREEQRNKLEQMASLEKRSVSNLIEVMADERWERLVEQQGIAYAKTVAEAMNLKLDADNPADREKLRRAVLDLVAGRKMRKEKGASLSR